MELENNSSDYTVYTQSVTLSQLKKRFVLNLTVRFLHKYPVQIKWTQKRKECTRQENKRP